MFLQDQITQHAKLHIEVLCTGCNGKPLVSQSWEPNPAGQTDRMSAAWVCVHESKCPVFLWGAHNSFLFSSSFLFTCHEVTALSCIGFHAPVRQDQLIPIVCCEYTSIINNQMDPYCIKRTLSRRKRGADDHSFDRLPWQFCLFPKWICISVPQCVTVMPLWRYTLQAKRKENCQTKAFCPAACWSDLTHSLQSLHNSVLAWMVWKPKIGIPVTQAHLSNYFPQIPSRLATAQNIHFNGKPVQVKLHHDEDLPSSWRVLSHRTIEQYKQHQTKSKNIQPALTICNNSYQSSSYQPLLKVHTGNGSAGGVCPAWNNVDCDYMWWVSAAVCCSCNHGVDFTVFFHIKCVFFRSRLHIMFSDAIDHWMFWQCPNVSFFRQIWRKNQQPPVIYSVSIWHDLPCMLFGGVWLGASCCGKVQLRSIEMCASARNISCLAPIAKNISCVAPRCVQVQEHHSTQMCARASQSRSIEMCASARNISCVAPRCVQVQGTSVA